MFEEKKSLAIIIPFYNPCATWKIELKTSIFKIEELFNDVTLSFYIVNDGSDHKFDRDLAEIDDEIRRLTVLSYTKNQGKGFAIRKGLALAEADLYIYSDWDFPFGEHAVLEVYQNLICSGCDLCVGNRSEKYFNALPPIRNMVSKGLRFFSRMYFRGKLIDSQSGIKGLTNRSKKVFLSNKTKSFVFEIEFIHELLKRKLPISCINISPKEHIDFSDLSFKTITKECFNLIKIVCK